MMSRHRHSPSTRRRTSELSPPGAEVVLMEAGERQSQTFASFAFGSTASRSSSSAGPTSTSNAAGPDDGARPIPAVPPRNGAFAAAPAGVSTSCTNGLLYATNNNGPNAGWTGRASIGSDGPTPAPAFGRGLPAFGAGATADGGIAGSSTNIAPAFSGYASKSGGNGCGNGYSSGDVTVPPSSIQASTLPGLVEQFLQSLSQSGMMNKMSPEQRRAMAQNLSEVVRSSLSPANGVYPLSGESSLAIAAAAASASSGPRPTSTATSVPVTIRDAGLPPTHPESLSESKTASLSDSKLSAKRSATSSTSSKSAKRRRISGTSRKGSLKEKKRAGHQDKDRRRRGSITKATEPKAEIYVYKGEACDLNANFSWLPTNADGAVRANVKDWETLGPEGKKARFRRKVDLQKEEEEHQRKQLQKAEKRKKDAKRKRRERAAKKKGKENRQAMSASVDSEQPGGASNVGGAPSIGVGAKAAAAGISAEVEVAAAPGAPPTTADLARSLEIERGRINQLTTIFCQLTRGMENISESAMMQQQHIESMYLTP